MRGNESESEAITPGGKTHCASKAKLRQMLQEAGVPFELSGAFYRRTALAGNGAQGSSGELLVNAATLDLLRQDPSFDETAIPDTQCSLKTPYGIRRIDLYFAATRFAIEIKSGYVRATSGFRKQVKKDVWLMKNEPKQLSEVLWMFLGGATVPARRHLDQNQIAWIDFDLQNARPPAVSDWPQDKPTLLKTPSASA